MRAYTLTDPIDLRHGRQWVKIPAGARVDLVRRAELDAGDIMRATLDRANGRGFSRDWRVVRIVEAWPPLPARHRVVVRASYLRPATVGTSSP